MKQLHSVTALTGALLLLLAVASLPAQTTAPSTTSIPPAATAPAVSTPVPAEVDQSTPILPESRDDSDWWISRHQEKVARIKKGNVDLLFIGDSITHQWETEDKDDPSANYLPIWQEYYGDRNAVNLGVSGDETQEVLWRFAHGELDGISPKAAVVMIGTNNTARHPKWTAADDLSGVLAVVEDLHRRLPQTKILLLAIFPSKVRPEKSAKDQIINTDLQSIYAGSSYVQFLDIGDIFRKNGEPDPSLYHDKTGKCLHPNVTGQRKWAEAIEPTISQMLGDKNKLTK